MFTKGIRRVARFSKRHVIIIAAVVCLAGAVWVWQSRAAGTPIAFGAESGIVAGPAAKVANANASGGSTVKFGPATPTPTPTPTPGGFVHPGVLLSKAQLDFVKNTLTANPSAAPYAATLARTQTATTTLGQVYGSSTYTAHPIANLSCDTTNPGCTAIEEDSVAAYTLALNYYYSNATDRAKYATASINVLNKWSSTLTSYTGNASRLRTAFSAGNFAQAAEIIRYTYTPASGQPVLNITALNTMFTNVMVPNITAGDPNSNGNWELSMAYSMVNMGVFMNNQTVFDRGLALWRQRVPAYIYMTSDGANPVNVPGGKYDTQAKEDCYWAGAGTVTTSCTLPSGFSYHQGMVQETCRDMDHVSLGLNAMANTAETAHIQGVDLYGEQKARILAGLEFTAQYDAYAKSNGWTVPSWLCGGTFSQMGGYMLGWEIAYNHYNHRLGVAMPYTQAFITNIVRPSSYKAYTIAAWQSLTHPNTP